MSLLGRFFQSPRQFMQSPFYRRKGSVDNIKNTKPACAKRLDLPVVDENDIKWPDVSGMTENEKKTHVEKIISDLQKKKEQREQKAAGYEMVSMTPLFDRLYDLAEKDSFILNICKEQKYADIWRWRLETKYGNSKVGGFCIMPQATRNSFEHLLATNLEILCAKRGRCDGVWQVYADAAEIFGSFYALKVHLHEEIHFVRTKSNTAKVNVSEMCKRAHRIAQLHDTAGYLMEAIAYLNLGLYQDNLSIDQKKDLESYFKGLFVDQQRGKFDLTTACFEFALICFYTALFLEPHSAAPMNNAYWGSNVFKKLNEDEADVIVAVGDNPSSKDTIDYVIKLAGRGALFGAAPMFSAEKWRVIEQEAREIANRRLLEPDQNTPQAELKMESYSPSVSWAAAQIPVAL